MCVESPDLERNDKNTDVRNQNQFFMENEKKKKKQEKKNSFSHEYAIEMINVSISFKCNHIVHVLLICEYNIACLLSCNGNETEWSPIQSIILESSE